MQDNLDQVRKDAVTFVNNYGGEDVEEGIGRYLAFIEYDDDQDLEDFELGNEKDITWIDVSTAAGKAAAIKEINDEIDDENEDEDGSNLDAALKEAEAVIKNKPDKIAIDPANVVVLTDGMPNLYLSKKEPSEESGHAMLMDKDNDNEPETDTLESLDDQKIEGETYYICGVKDNVGIKGSQTINEKTAVSADALQAVANVYTVRYGEDGATYEGGPNASAFLKDNIASKPENALEAGQIQQITDPMTGAFYLTVRDNQPANNVTFQGITLDDKKGFDWNLAETTPVEGKDGDKTTYTYTKTYTVKLNPADSTDSKTYPLNGKTNLTVNGDDPVPFPIPAVEKAPTHKVISYTVEYYKDGTFDHAAEPVTKEVPVADNELAIQKTAINANDAIDSVGDVTYSFDYIEIGTQQYTDVASLPENVSDKTVIKVYYAKDVMGKTGPTNDQDGTPDKYQAGIQYVAGENGSVNPTWELVDLKDENNERVEQATMEVNGSKATADETFKLDQWTLEPLTAVSYEEGKGIQNDEIKPTMGLVGGTIYTFTASFVSEDVKLRVTKEALPKEDGTSYHENDAVTYLITVFNDGKDAAENVVINETLPGAVFVENEALYTLQNKGTQATVGEVPGKGSVVLNVTYTVNKEQINSNSKVVNSITIGEGQTKTNEIPITKDLTYKVQYYQDAQANGNPIAKTVDVPYQQNTVTVNQADIAPLDKYEGYVFDKVEVEPNHGLDVIENGDVINVYYVSDNWHDADMTDPTDDVDSKTGGDGIADEKQVNIKFVSADEKQGTVTGDNILQIITPEEDQSSAKPVKDGVNVEPKPGYEIDYWKNDDGQIVDNPFEVPVNKGEAVVYTAHFKAVDPEKPNPNPNPGPGPSLPEIPNAGADELNTVDHYSYIVGYEDGTVRPEAQVTRAEVATIFFRLLTDDSRNAGWCQTNNYSDVAADAWYSNAVSTLSNMGIIVGYEDGTFRPNAPITRAEYAKIAVSFYDIALDDYYGVFSDVPNGQWYTRYVETAAAIGLIHGMGDGTFAPNKNITRAQACELTNNTLNRKPDKEHMLPAEEMINWPDNQPGSWYYAAVQEATNSHDYEWDGELEQWTVKLDQRDWVQLEKEWSEANSATGGGEVKDEDQ